MIIPWLYQRIREFLTQTQRGLVLGQTSPMYFSVTFADGDLKIQPGSSDSSSIFLGFLSLQFKNVGDVTNITLGGYISAFLMPYLVVQYPHNVQVIVGLAAGRSKSSLQKKQ